MEEQEKIESQENPQVEEEIITTPTPESSTPTQSQEASPEQIPQPASSDQTSTELPSSHILRVSSLYKQFGHKKVVRGVEFSMQMGEVLGPNCLYKLETLSM